jgi:hypothetical protein
MEKYKAKINIYQTHQPRTSGWCLRLEGRIENLFNFSFEMSHANVKLGCQFQGNGLPKLRR